MNQYRIYSKSRRFFPRRDLAGVAPEEEFNEEEEGLTAPKLKLPGAVVEVASPNGLELVVEVIEPKGFPPVALVVVVPDPPKEKPPPPWEGAVPEKGFDALWLPPKEKPPPPEDEPVSPPKGFEEDPPAGNAEVDDGVVEEPKAKPPPLVLLLSFVLSLLLPKAKPPEEGVEV